MNVPEEEIAVGFDLGTQKLHCLIALNDLIGQALSENAGDAFFRAFIVEDRKTGEIVMNERFRYKDGDSWSRLKLDKERQRLPLRERVEYLATAIERTLRMAAESFAGMASPDGLVVRHYPPNPEDGEKTMEWLIAEDLVEVKSIEIDGVDMPINKGSDSVM